MALFLTRAMGGGEVTSEWRDGGEIKLSQDGKIMHLRATGKGSHVYILTAYSNKNSPYCRLHFATLLEQKGEWELTSNGVYYEGKYLLIDHLEKYIQIAVYDSSESARNKLAGIYNDVEMNVEQSYAGYVFAACWRWLKDEVMNYELGLEYSCITNPGSLFEEDNKTNCFRLVASQYLHLKLPYDIAKMVTTEKNLGCWLGHLKSCKELKYSWKFGLSLLEDLKWISRKHRKLSETINEIAEQFSKMTASSPDFAGNLLKSLEVQTHYFDQL